MKKHTNKLLLSSGLVAVSIAALGAVYHCTAKQLMKMALDREENKIFTKEKEKMLRSQPFLDVTERMTQSAEELEKADCEEVVIHSHDGIQLVGHWRSTKNPARIIIAMHGWRSNWAQDFGTIAAFWEDNRCSVLYAEQRGQGESGGAYMGFGLLERYDCLEWIRWVNTRTGGNLPVYLCGVSMGAATVLMTAGSALPDNVCGIIADCAYTSPTAIWKHVAENNLHIPYGIYKSIADDICRKKIRTESDTYSCLEAMTHCAVPVLFIHGTDDRLVPIEMTYQNYQACAAEKRLFVVPGADHGMSYLTDRTGYERELLGFWAKHDKTPLP